MVTLEWSCERSDGVTLVSLVVAADRPCRVRVENRLDGPVWPPRRRGQPAAGWDGDAFAGRVPADGQLTVGYATPARPADPPAEVVSTEPAAESGNAADGPASGPAPAVEATPAGVVRDLGDPVVPRDSVPVPEPNAAAASRSDEAARTGDDASVSDGVQSADELQSTDRAPGPERLVVPGAVRSWLRDVDERLDAAAVRTAGTSDGATAEGGLGAAVAADRRALRRVRSRIDGLLARAAEGDRDGRTAGRIGERAGGDEPAARGTRVDGGGP
ncbi:hypothetical protein C475_04446 [Halosimplex carlsbadense 2-9-1]|uniref:Uncharacterized protein n=1 Tax=Halosimplex carlsbadense 2-9-1 TaxID=797114 RepID=M0D2D2_9EURY|nr:hypothetical protein [Halosimplex carlsbadense]ELZ28857.1 hypothetical protein C475_04446 [Halosimplex carlsbadense 2-9-1]